MTLIGVLGKRSIDLTREGSSNLLSTACPSWYRKAKFERTLTALAGRLTETSVYCPGKPRMIRISDLSTSLVFYEIRASMARRGMKSVAGSVLIS